MQHIVGFRKIISFKIGIKKYTKLFEKNKVDYHDLELLFEKKLVYVVLIVLLNQVINNGDMACGVF
jgi:hypothetical protein